jgi:hypothetical protein
MGLFDALLGASQGFVSLAEDHQKKEDTANNLQYQTALATGDKQGFLDAAQKLGMGDVSGSDPYFDQQATDRTNKNAAFATDQAEKQQNILASKASVDQGQQRIGIEQGQFGLSKDEFKNKVAQQLISNAQWQSEFHNKVSNEGIRAAQDWAHLSIEAASQKATAGYQAGELANNRFRTQAEWGAGGPNTANKQMKAYEQAGQLAGMFAGKQPDPLMDADGTATRAWEDRKQQAFGAILKANGIAAPDMSGANMPTPTPSTTPVAAPGFFQNVYNAISSQPAAPTPGGPTPSKSAAPNGPVRPIAPGFTPTPYGTPNPDTPGTFGPLGRSPRPGTATGNTPQTDALKANILQHYPGAAITSEFRDYATQKSLHDAAVVKYGAANANTYVADPATGSHTFGAALDVVIGPKLREQFKADMRARGLRAYDEGTHVHVDDRTDLPQDGPGGSRPAATAPNQHPTRAATGGGNTAAAKGVLSRFAPVPSSSPPN